jgi:hypothetical protein
MLGAAGQFLERSICDRVVGTPERLIFEGAPVLIPPVAQDAASRLPTAIEGGLLDTVAACPSLDLDEQTLFGDLLAKERAALAPAAAKAQERFITERAEELVARGMDPARARATIERQSAGVLLPGVVLPFDDDDLAGCTVADVLDDPERFEGATLADPLEGIEYGRGKAKVLLRPDGTPWINSFAHGRTVYRLQNDAANIAAITVLAGERHKAADQGLAAMHATCVALYQRDRSLVRVCMVKAKNADGEVILVPGIVPVTAAMLGRALGQSARWEKINSKGVLIRLDPPKEVVEQILGMIGEWPFPPLSGVIHDIDPRFARRLPGRAHALDQRPPTRQWQKLSGRHCLSDRHRRPLRRPLRCTEPRGNGKTPDRRRVVRVPDYPDRQLPRHPARRLSLPSDRAAAPATPPARIERPDQGRQYLHGVRQRQ